MPRNPWKTKPKHTQDMRNLKWVGKGGGGTNFLRFFIPSGDLHLSERRATKTATTTLWLRSSVTLNRSECECSFFFSFLRPGWVDYSAAIRWATCRTSTCHLPLAPSWLWLELEFETTAGACKNVLQNAQEMHIKYLTDMPYNFFPAMWVTPPGWLIICFLFPSLECNNLSRLHLNGDNQQVLKNPTAKQLS